MMTKDVVLSRVAAIVTTLAEVNGTPESMLYILCDMNMADYETLRDILVRANLVTIKGHFVTLTEQGEQTAIKLNLVINKAN